MNCSSQQILSKSRLSIVSAIAAVALVACGSQPAAEVETDAATEPSSGSDTDGSATSSEETSDGTTSNATSSSGTTTGDSTTGATTQEPPGSTGDEETTGVDPTGGDPVLPPTSAGCGAAVPDGWLSPYQLHWGAYATASSMVVSGSQRQFIVTLPPNYDPNTAYPMHIVFHAWTSNMDNGYGKRVENRWDEPVIAVAPQGQPVQGDGYGWEWWETDSIDYEFVDALVDEVGANVCVDNRRIFTSGTSNGGYMAQMVACLTGYVKGVGASAGGMPVPPSNCVAPVGAFLMHGNADTVVPISEGTTARDAWLERNGCSDSSTPAVEGRCDHYSDCSSGAEVYWCEHDGAHPGAEPNALGLSEPMIDLFQSMQ
jgi:poly(3-hydroxybutyrate) depolymerase